MSPSLEGLITEQIGEVLAELASKVPPDQAIVEIGSYKGQSTCYLASRASALVWAIDPWDLTGNRTGKHGFARPETYRTFLRQTASYGNIRHMKAFSADAARRWEGPPIGLLYIDGDHTERGVRTDWNSWSPHLAPDATVIFDDYQTPRNPGVEAVVKTLPFECSKVAGRLAVGIAP